VVFGFSARYPKTSRLPKGKRGTNGKRGRELTIVIVIFHVMTIAAESS
jgi:hypothetical protein